MATNNFVGAIEGFKNQIRNVQRASLFDVSIPNYKYSTANPQFLKFSVKAAEFPASTVGDIQVNYMGRVIHWYGDREYGGTWQTTCILDGQWQTFNNIYKWSQGMGGANKIVSEDINSHQNFKTDAYVTAYSTDGRPAHRVQLHGLWPQDVGAISMDWGQQNAAVEVQVTWVYDYVTTITSGVSENIGRTEGAFSYYEGANSYKEGKYYGTSNS